MKIEELQGKTFDEAVALGLEVRRYTPIANKVELINLLKSSAIKVDEAGMEYVDIALYKLIETNLIALMYTNIEISDGDSYNYDVLHENDIYMSILLEIGCDEEWEFKDLMHDMIYDEVERYNSAQRILMDKANELIMIIDKTMDHVNAMLDRGDPNKIATTLGKVVKPLIAKLPDFSKVDMTDLASLLNKKGSKFN